MANKVENRTVNMYINGQPVTNDINSMRRAYRDLSREVGKLDRNSKEYRDGVRQLRQLNSTLTQHRQQLRQVESSWGRVRKQAMAFAGGLGIAGGITAIAAGMRSIVSGATDVIMNFEKSNSRLNAVLGLTKDQTAALREQQLLLGSSTEFTASQAADAQTELAKLGFEIREITDLTPRVLSLASASGSDLPNAAAIAGSTLRQFNMDSAEAGRVVDVMAASFSKSALDIEKFSTAMASAGPVAANAGETIEQTTAKLAILVDRGLDASTAGTSLRNMYLTVAKDGTTFEKAMDRIRMATDQNAEAMRMFGTRGATSAVIIANNTEALVEMEGALDNVAGTARRMADEQLNNLAGDMTKLKSAWEGFILSVENGDGVLARVSRTITQTFTNALNLLADDSRGAMETFAIFATSLIPGAANNLKMYALETKALNDAMLTMQENAQQMIKDNDLAGLASYRDHLRDVRDEYTEGSVEYKKLIEEENRIQDIIVSRAQEGLGRNRAGVSLPAETIASLNEELQAMKQAQSQAEINGSIYRALGEEIATLEARIKSLTMTEKERQAIAAKEQADAEKKMEEAQKATLDAIKAEMEGERLLLMEERARGLLEEEEFQQEMLDMKLAYMLIEKEALQSMGMETVTLEQQIADLRIAALKRVEDAHASDEEADRARHQQKLARLKEEADARQAAAEAAIMSAAMQGSSAASVGDASKLQARDVVNSMRDVVKAYIAQAVAAQAAEVLSKVPPPFSLALAAAAGFAATALFDTLIPAFAGGTRYAPGGMALVGEQGPELMSVPQGASITPAPDSRNLMSRPDASVDFGSVPTLSGGNASATGELAAMKASFDHYASKVDHWTRQLQVVQSQRAQDDWNQRYHSNERLVRNVKS